MVATFEKSPHHVCAHSSQSNHSKLHRIAPLLNLLFYSRFLKLGCDVATGPDTCSRAQPSNPCHSLFRLIHFNQGTQLSNRSGTSGTQSISAENKELKRRYLSQHEADCRRYFVNCGMRRPVSYEIA